VELESRVAGVPLHLAVPQLGRAGLCRRQLARDMALDRPIQMRPADLQPSLQIGKGEAGVLEIDDALAECLAVGRELDRFVEGALGTGLRADRDAEPFLRQLLHQMDEAARTVIRRLESEDDRGQMLYDLQDFLESKPLPGNVEVEVRWQALIKRKDIVEALDRVGRTQHYDIFGN